jgi:hypothetical protein
MIQLNRATEHLDPPFAVVDLDAFDANAAELAHRAAGPGDHPSGQQVGPQPRADRAGRPA